MTIWYPAGLWCCFLSLSLLQVIFRPHAVLRDFSVCRGPACTACMEALTISLSQILKSAVQPAGKDPTRPPTIRPMTVLSRPIQTLPDRFCSTMAGPAKCDPGLCISWTTLRLITDRFHSPIPTTSFSLHTSISPIFPFYSVISHGRQWLSIATPSNNC